MSTGSTWLHGQRKPELVEMAERVGLKDYAGLKKAELETALDEHLRANQSSLSKDSTFTEYFRRPSSGLVKKEASSATTLGEEIKKPRQRRITQAKAKDEVEPTDSSEPETYTALVTRTPRTSLSFASAIPLPPSPSVIVDQIDQQTARVRQSMSTMWERSGISEYTDTLRDVLSHTFTVEMISLLVELYGLQKVVLPMKAITMIPASRIFGTPAMPLLAPDFFKLLTAEFWTTSSLWFMASLVLPYTFAYFFNLTLKAKHSPSKTHKKAAPEAQYDPLTYNISKALITWMVYSQGIRFGGLVNDVSVYSLDQAIPGGYLTVLIGTGIGVLTSIYEAVLRK